MQKNQIRGYDELSNMLCVTKYTKLTIYKKNYRNNLVGKRGEGNTELALISYRKEWNI